MLEGSARTRARFDHDVPNAEAVKPGLIEDERLQGPERCHLDAVAVKPGLVDDECHLDVQVVKPRVAADEVHIASGTEEIFEGDRFLPVNYTKVFKAMHRAVHKSDDHRDRIDLIKKFEYVMKNVLKNAPKK